jgi:hypothetical protein
MPIIGRLIEYPADPDDALIEIEAVKVSPDITEDAVGQLVSAVLEAKSEAAAVAAPWEAVQAAARAKLSEVIAATGRTDWATPAGRAYVPAAGVSASYDVKALDALCKSSPDLAAILLPHRKETQRAGSLTIRGLN